MNVSELLEQLSEHNVQLWFEGNNLRYRAPKGVLKEGHLALLSRNKDQAIALLRQRASNSVFSFPLSYNQRAMWFIYQTAPASPAYNVAFTARIRSALDIDAFRSALQALVDRHSSLRTTYITDDGEPIQRIHGYLECPFQIREAPPLAATELKEEVIRAYKVPFDLKKGPLVRADLFACSTNDYVFLFTAHHIACDGWSFFVLLDELRTLYAPGAASAARLPRLKTEFMQFVESQKEFIQGETGERLLSYWKNQLAGELPKLNLPLDGTRPPILTFNGSSQLFSVDEGLSRRLKLLARDQGATLFTLLMAAFNVLLHKLSGQDDILVGSPAYGRNRADLSGIVGNLINTVALRSNLSGNPSFKDFLTRTRQVVLGAMEHQDYPFALLAERLRLPRDPSRTPIYQTMFILQKFGRAPDLEKYIIEGTSTQKLIFAGMETESFGIPQQEGQLELIMEMAESGKQLFGNLRYNTDLFDSKTVTRWVEQFKRLLESIAANPDQTISEIPIQCPENSMMRTGANTIELLSRLRKLGIEMRAENGRLRIDAPKGAVDAALREELSQRKAEILGFISKSSSQSHPEALPLHRVPRDQALCVSFAQERLWFLAQLDQDNVAYSISGGFHLKGNLRVDILEKSLMEIISRHESLRTTFGEMNGKPEQIISPASPFDLQLVDLRKLSEAERAKRSERLAAEVAQRPFDLARGPLLRGTLIQLGVEEHLLIIAMHHIITDGWSLGIFARELETLYRAFSEGQPSPLPDLRIQYADFAHCQREWLQGDVLDSQLSYWKEKLSGEIPVLQLPADRPRPAVQSYRGASELFKLPNRLREGLNRLSQQCGVTLYMTLLAALKALLHRYTGQTDFAVGSPIANRNLADMEPLIGFFVNTLVLRTDLSENPRFLNLLEKVKETALDAFAHQDTPFEKLVEALNPNRDMSYSPMFQVMFVLQVPMTSSKLPGLTLTPLVIETGSSMFDLTLFMWEDDKGLAGRIEYSTDLFNAETVKRFIGHFRTLLESVVVDPSRRLSELVFLTDAERHQILVTWNDTYADYPEKCLNRLFEEQAKRTPDAAAVVCAGTTLTYSELNSRANLVANHLLGLGAKPDDIIGIYTDRSIDMVVGLMGILKAGCAYTPLDPGFPEDRVQFMLQDSNSRILITQNHLRENISGFPGRMICIDSDWETISREKDNNPAPLCEPDNLAYVIYTSGSTGKPKGVQIPHKALVNFLYSMQKEPGLTREDRVLSVTTMSFDIFGLELFLPLLFGGKVVIAERDDTLDGLRLASMIEEHDVSIMQATPSTWRLLIESGWSGHESLKAICGGEAFPLDLVGPMLSRCKELWNLYGPTETTIWSTAFRIRSEDEPVLIGYPIDNTQIYILDNSLQPLPIGLVGELHIGGDGLSRGYLNRPELTAEKFIPHPLSDKPGARIYKTGDLARYRPDGSIECLGRIDHQVKLRGFRIELGEIEARIKDIEAVSNCVVALREDRPGDRRLVAYYVARDGAAISVPDARGYLQSKLPEYMVPQHFAKLEAIPLTPNGKVDKKALPKPVLEELSQEMFVAPRTEVESAVASVWQQVLKVDRVSVNSNFFELGGHSLLMVQVLNRIRGFSDKNIPIMALFQHPTIASLANYLAGQQPDQLSVGSEQIRPVSRGRDLELSFAQQRLWFLNQLEPDSVAYNLSGGVKLKGRLRVDILNQSLSEIILRHETLRTTFHEKDGKPIQVISPPSGLDIPVIDLHLQSGADRQAEIDQIIRKQAQDPFDLSKGPLLRSVLLRLDQEEHILLLTMQHIITDGWSYSIFASELETLYTAFSQGKPSPLPAPAIQYADFAYWQREWLQGEVLDAQLGYWKKQLSPEPPALQLPTDRPRPAVQTHRGAHLPINLPLFLADKVKELSQRHGATLFMILLAAFDALLFRYTAQADFAVGSPVASRNRSEIEGLIGFFVNTLVLRADLSGDPDFSELIDRVRKVCIEAYSNEELPFEKLIDEIRPTRDMSYSPLFQVMFAFQNVPGAAIELPELTLAPISIDCGSSMFDLTLFMWEDDKGLSGRIEYSTDLFNAETVERFIGHFRTLLESVVADPSRRLSDLAFLPDAERHQLLVTWNDTYAHYPEKCVNRLFEEQAERTSDSVAVICAGRSLSYGELNRRANRVANHLLGRGAKPDDIIGIYTDRSIDMVVGLMGILKAGSAYTPLDPGFPEDRVEFMLQDSNSRILITQSHLKGNIDFPGQMICIDSDWETISREKDNNPAPLCEPDNLAYVIYTSGSTGKPKGVQIPHRALVNFLYSMEKKPGLTREDIVLSVTTMSFDIFGLELFLPLLFGGKVVIAERDDTLDGLRLASMIEEHGVSIMQATPSTWRLLIESGWSGHESLKAICGGEAFPLDLVGPMLSRCKEVWNLYGPTETTIWSTAFRIRSEDEPVFIGYPVDNTQIYILDNSLQPLPIGLVGELHIGGDGLSRGYLNRPELTAEKFIPHPLSDQPGARIYKTGDLARYRPDGSIECLGRIDHQVKLRGFRIELGEIEARVKDIEAVSNCVVALREDRPGDRRLVAYYVARNGATVSVPDLRSYLQSKLPEYMVPQHFAKLEAIPLTPNGKVDKKALPKPVLEELSQEKFVAPRTEVESALASVWQQVLKVDRVSVNSNFFELGGQSLLMVQVLNRIRGFSDKNIPIMALFQHPTIASLANYLVGQQPDRPSVSSEQIRPVSRNRDLELSFAQQRLWFLNQLEPDSHAYNLSGGVKLKGRLRVDILNRSLSEIIFRHETLRTTFHEKDGKPIQVISPPSGLDLPVIDLHLQSGADRQAEIDQIVRKQAQDPFDLSKGPLLRSVLLRLDQEEHILLLTMHHIITDGWSLGVLVQEMATFYEAFSQGTIPPLPPLPIQYADFAEWQREWFQGEVLESQVSYWKEQLGGDLPILALPTDRPRPAMPTYQGKIKSLVLSKTLHEALVALSQREGVTLFMTLLAAFQALLHRYTGQDDIIVGSPIANRNRLETEGLIGFFANTLVLRTDLSGNPTFRKLLVRVREMALGAYAHQDLPFERLVEELHVARDLSYNPLFQVMLVFQNASLEPLQLSGLTLTPLATETGSAKFDLTLELIEGPRGLAGSIEYNTDLFDSDTIERMAGHFQILLQGIIANPDSRLSELQLLTEAERHQLLEWNATQTDYPRDKCIQELFEEQVERIPDAVALVFKDQRLTYRELNRRANQLARHLRNLGVGPEVLVGICMERSLEMVVGLLGILKAGGAYVPLDSAYPRERLAFMVEDTRIAVLLTQRRTMPAIQDFALKMLCLDTDSAAIAGEDGENVPVCSAADNLAYVMYTSGSTGTPKGVEVLHRGVVRLVINTNFARLDGKGTFLQLAPISFDASTFELWAALLNGATCILYSADAPSTDKLAAHIRGHSVSTLWLTSSLFNAIIDEDPQSLRGVSQVLIGGEQLSAPHVICAQENLPETQIINGYGPTENTTFTCCYSIPQGLSRDTTMIPIGRPIANTEVYILDKHRQLVPINVHGELFAGGDGLARGYLNRPELTEEKFIPHPLSDKPGARIYKTGDLARYRPDGSIECLGRIDHQVKLRGFRIELGEIEARVKDIEAVSNCVVALREDRPGDRRLVAYYVARDGDAISVPDVRGYLQSKLPEYMVPQHFVKLEAIPLTPNGKVDKKVLPKPVLEELSQEKFVAPRTEIESAVASVWQQVLKVDRVSVNSNFFELGGNSLLMVQVLNRIRGFSDKDIPIMALFQHPTIASLANYLVGQQSDRPSFQQAYDRTQRQEKALMRQEQLRRAREKVNE